MGDMLHMLEKKQFLVPVCIALAGVAGGIYIVLRTGRQMKAEH